MPKKSKKRSEVHNSETSQEQTTTHEDTDDVKQSEKKLHEDGKKKRVANGESEETNTKNDNKRRRGAKAKDDEGSSKKRVRENVEEGSSDPKSPPNGATSDVENSLMELVDVMAPRPAGGHTKTKPSPEKSSKKAVESENAVPSIAATASSSANGVAPTAQLNINEGEYNPDSGEWVWNLTSDIRLRVGTFRGKQFVDIRHLWQDKPTKKARMIQIANGVCFVKKG